MNEKPSDVLIHIEETEMEDVLVWTDSRQQTVAMIERNRIWLDGFKAGAWAVGIIGLFLAGLAIGVWGGW